LIEIYHYEPTNLTKEPLFKLLVQYKDDEQCDAMALLRTMSHLKPDEKFFLRVKNPVETITCLCQNQ